MRPKGEPARSLAAAPRLTNHVEAAVIGPTMPLSIPAARIPGGLLRRDPNVKTYATIRSLDRSLRQTSARRRTGQSQLRHNLAGVAAVGNIFTREDCRGQGLAQI